MSRPLLISTYELGHQPLMLANAQGALQAAGIACDVVDAHVTPPTVEQLKDASIIAIAVPMHTALRLGLEIVRSARRHGSTARMIMFGLYAVLHEEMLRAESIETTLHLEKLFPSVEKPRPVRANLPQLDAYAHLLHDGESRRAGYVEATLGCKHTCRHCPITPVYKGRFTAIDRTAVLDDISALVEQGAEHITFGDPDFLNGPTHSTRIIDAMHARHPRVTWDATIKVQHLLKHADLLPGFQEKGCLFIVSAVESFSDVVLGKLEKHHTAEDAIRAIRLVRAAGITLRPTFVSFSPWGTAADYLRMLDVIDDEKLHSAVDPVQLAIRLLIPAGSALVEISRGEPWLGPFNADQLSHSWTHPDVRMDALARELNDVVGRAANADPVDTLVHAMSLARERLGAARPASLPDMKERAPRLDESWFC